MAAKKAAPWKRKRPTGPRTKLTAKSKAAAKAAAKKAGRKYPNLVDNMRAATKQKARNKKSD
jgi:ribosomal protein L15E